MGGEHGASAVTDLALRRELLGGHELDTDRARLDVERIHRWLSTDAYWAMGRSVDVLRRAIDGSACFGVYAPDGAQVGFARLITDGATFGWLCDVYIDRGARGLGLGTALAKAIVEAVEPLRLKRLMLVTADAHEVYVQAGFALASNPEQLMARVEEPT